jgi:hypothetical protein
MVYFSSYLSSTYTNSGLSLDVFAKWNLTFLMLRDVVYYKLAFERLKSYEHNMYEHIYPSPQDHENAQTFHLFLNFL